MNYVGHFEDKDGNKYFLTKELGYSIGKISDNTEYMRINGVKIGDIYEIAMSYNFNPQGSSNYRSTLYAILTINCGYNGSSVVVRPRIDVLANYYGTATQGDSRVKVVCEGGETERTVPLFNSEKGVYLYFTRNDANINPTNFEVKIRKLN